MYPLAWEARGTECMKYCQTRENCAYACGLEPLISMEEYTVPAAEEQDGNRMRFIMNGNIFSKPEKQPVYSR